MRYTGSLSGSSSWIDTYDPESFSWLHKMETDRQIEEQIEQSRLADQQHRGVKDCPVCGFEVGKTFLCYNERCRHEGCRNCMKYDPKENAWFCGHECMIDFYLGED